MPSTFHPMPFLSPRPQRPQPMALLQRLPRRACMSSGLAVALVAVLSGCATLSTPDTRLPELAVPAAWSQTAPATGALAGQAPSAASAATPAAVPSLAQWWLRLDDAQLTRLIDQALQANTTVRSAQAALRQARAQGDVQAAGLLPSVGTSASTQRSRSSNNTGNSFQAGFDASWEPDVFGRLRSGVQASAADIRASEFSLADVQVSLAAEVAASYIELRGAQSRLEIARRNLASQRETLQITEWRLQAGLITSLALEQARASTEQTAAQVPALQATLDQTRYSLAVLTGLPPAALDAQLAAVAAVPQPPDDLALSIPADTLRQRPDVRMAEQRITAALARVSQADAARYPSFRIGGSLGLRALTLGALGNGAAVASSLLGSVSVPLFDGGAAKAQVRVQEAALEQARIGYENTVMTALQDVENALSALRSNRERLAHLKTASQAAANADLLAQHRYNSGLIDFQAVLETQRTLLSTQDGVAVTTANLAANHVQLYKALGGGWSAQ